MKLSDYKGSICGYDVSLDEGNAKFNKQLDEIDFGGKTSPEYREAKLILLAYFFNRDMVSIKNVVRYGRGLVYGLESATPIDEEPSLGQAVDSLELDPKTPITKAIKHQGEKLEEIFDLLNALANMEPEEN